VPHPIAEREARCHAKNERGDVVIEMSYAVSNEHGPVVILIVS